jgi:hypothetical protein
MGSFWTVKPQTVRKTGEWNGREFSVELKKRLTAGEDRAMKTGAFKHMSMAGQKQDNSGGSIEIDWSAMGIQRILTYVIDWSLEDDDGVKMKINRSTVEACDPTFVDVLNDIINDHEAEVEEEKKAPTGATPPA